MTNSHKRTVIYVVIALLCTGQINASHPQELRLASLTVPADKLPAGCRLAPVTRSPSGEILFVMHPSLKENPWTGTSPVTGATIREVIEGPPRGEAANLTGRELHAKQGEGVLESYRAQYLAPDGSKVDVYAVRFNDSKLTVPASLSQLDKRGRAGRIIVHESTAVLVLTGSEGDCFRAVSEYIASLR